MSAKILNGNKLAEQILLQAREKVSRMDKKPGLAAILVGEDEASKIYLAKKEEACKQTYINFHSYNLPEDTSEDKSIEVINFLNNDPEINGILVQLPLPKKFDTDKIISAINPDKDIDGFQPKSPFTSPTALGVLELLKETKMDLTDKKIVILSNSEKFAEPFKKLMPNSVITNKIADLKNADVVIVALGKPHYIKPKMIKKDSILIDVGISKVDDKTLGDIDHECDKVAAFRSPVPGGVGPMTVAMLLTNLTSNSK